ncbi:phage tail domain-containing protein [Levilactobacillus brevis]|uniref:phage tail domain-containing protein n=1 Tax=Levilactobacillus brevis TaxID=1580 RepID=UPI00116292EA|nr:phage tail domain-containing protein [Levilactobacillus brevis]QCZ50989.1 putative phage tail protein [Levilactobacillus brevis]
MAFNDVNTFDYAFDENGTGGFNSDKDLEVLVNHVSKPIAPTITESFQDVPGRYGGVFLGNSYGEKQIDIPITMYPTDRDDYNRILNNLSKPSLTRMMMLILSTRYGSMTNQMWSIMVTLQPFLPQLSLMRGYRIVPLRLPLCWLTHGVSTSTGH